MIVTSYRSLRPSFGSFSRWGRRLRSSYLPLCWLFLVLSGCVLVTAPAASVASGAVTPANGVFQARLFYKLGTRAERSLLRVTVVGHKIRKVHMTTSSLLPYNPNLSHGLCNEQTRIVTDGDRSQGGTRRSGQFGYTFSANTPQYTDRVTIGGAFTNPNHVSGKVRDVFTLKGKTFGSHCDTGELKFSASRH